MEPEQKPGSSLEGCSSEGRTGLPAVPGPGTPVELRKSHACGGRVWTVIRANADAVLECSTCRRRISLTRDELRRRMKRVLTGG